MLPPALRVKSRRADVTTRPRKPFPYAVKQARLECETGFLVLLKARPLAPAPADFSAPDIFSHAPAVGRASVAGRPSGAQPVCARTRLGGEAYRTRRWALVVATRRFYKIVPM